MRDVTFWGIGAVGWSALTAIGTFTLAATTVLVVALTNRRDNRLRREDQLRVADLEARQVEVSFGLSHPVQGLPVIEIPMVVVTSPRSLPRLLRVEGCVRQETSGNPSIVVFDPPKPEQSTTADGYVYMFQQDLKGGLAVIRFTDWRGNLYYMHKGYTERFEPGTEWLDAIRQVDEHLTKGTQREKPNQ